MPQIAQQDYIVVDIADIDSITDAEKAELRKYLSAGLIFDVILSYNDGAFRSKIIYASDYTVAVFSQPSSEVVEISISE